MMHERYFVRVVIGLMTFIFMSAGIATEVKAEFRCQGRLIDGFSKYDVLRYCGEPLYTDSYHKHIVFKHKDEIIKTNCEEIDVWYYENGVKKYSVSLTFNKGIVNTISHGKPAP